jgi:hypothetical protein
LLGKASEYVEVGPYFRQLIAGSSSQITGFGIKEVCMEFIAEKISLGNVYFIIFSFPGKKVKIVPVLN